MNQLVEDIGNFWGYELPKNILPETVRIRPVLPPESVGRGKKRPYSAISTVRRTLSEEQAPFCHYSEAYKEAPGFFMLINEESCLNACIPLLTHLRVLYPSLLASAKNENIDIKPFMNATEALLSALKEYQTERSYEQLGLEISQFAKTIRQYDCDTKNYEWLEKYAPDSFCQERERGHLVGGRPDTVYSKSAYKEEMEQTARAYRLLWAVLEAGDWICNQVGKKATFAWRDTHLDDLQKVLDDVAENLQVDLFRPGMLWAHIPPGVHEDIATEYPIDALMFHDCFVRVLQLVSKMLYRDNRLSHIEPLNKLTERPFSIRVILNTSPTYMNTQFDEEICFRIAARALEPIEKIINSEEDKTYSSTAWEYLSSALRELIEIAKQIRDCPNGVLSQNLANSKWSTEFYGKILNACQTIYPLLKKQVEGKALMQNVEEFVAFKTLKILLPALFHPPYEAIGRRFSVFIANLYDLLRCHSKNAAVFKQEGENILKEIFKDLRVHVTVQKTTRASIEQALQIPNADQQLIHHTGVKDYLCTWSDALVSASTPDKVLGESWKSDFCKTGMIFSEDSSLCQEPFSYEKGVQVYLDSRLPDSPIRHTAKKRCIKGVNP